MNKICNPLKFPLRKQENCNLNDISYGDKSVPLFSFKGILTDAKVVSIYDGDTCQCVFVYEKRFIRLKVRLNGIDTPELRNPEQKESALQAKQYLQDLCQQNAYIVFLECLEFDKYGRLLANIYANKDEYQNKQESFNTLLIHAGHAYSYDGGTKRT